jgi:exocyst complex component 2
MLAKSAGHEEWQAITHLVNRLSTVLMDRLPDFWRIAKGHMEGKYTKVSQEQPRFE